VHESTAQKWRHAQETADYCEKDKHSGSMESRRSARKRGRVLYLEPTEKDTWRYEKLKEEEEEAWEEDWMSSEEEKEVENCHHEQDNDAAVKPKRPVAKEMERRKKRRQSMQCKERNQELVEAEPNQTREQRKHSVLRFLEEARNTNTKATYASAWRQFTRWCMEVENPQRKDGEKMDPEKPEESEVAAYLQYIVMVKGGTLATATAARAAIADHLKYVVTDSYNPCRGKIVDAMMKVLTPMAEPSRQKKELIWEQMEKMAVTMERAMAKEEERHVAMRDRCMIMLAYFAYLRTSEVARMQRQDVEISEEEIEGKRTRVLRVYVDSACKNDVERKGHERLVAEREQRERWCMVRLMETWLKETNERPKEGPLFPKEDGTFMSADTPRGRLKKWLQAIGVNAPEEYGFHSLRAGAATEAARAGVEERLIKLHGNWRSDAVRVYMRAGVKERLQASSVLGRTNC
jgi:integrase